MSTRGTHRIKRAPRVPLSRRLIDLSYSGRLIWICHPLLMIPWREWAWVRQLRWERECRRGDRAMRMRLDAALPEPSASSAQPRWHVLPDDGGVIEIDAEGHISPRQLIRVTGTPEDGPA
jgi:hypothetical protein